MYSCGDIGRERADEVLIRVPLRLHEQTAEGEAQEKIRAGEIVGVLKDINKTCFDYRREAVRRAVCRVCLSLFLRVLEFIFFDPSGTCLIYPDCCSNVCPRERLRSSRLLLHISRRLARTWTRC